MHATRGPKKQSRVFDGSIYVIAILAPVMTLPQLYKVWVGGQAQGVSIFTWATYAIISVFWVTYGVKLRAKPIIFTNGLLMIVDSLIVLGVLFRK